MILVVDDHLDSCEMLVRLLRVRGYRSICIDGGAKALDYLKGHRPALVFLDVMMPGVNGFDVLRALKADPALGGLPVVMYSAMADPATCDTARELGARDFMVKGRMMFEDLKGVIERNLGRSN
jgi:twitching motility two-component system response regulator PilH